MSTQQTLTDLTDRTPNPIDTTDTNTDLIPEDFEVPDFSDADDMPTMFYCWACLGGLDGILDNVPVLTSAGVAWRNPGPEGFNVHLPNASPHMIDSGGYQAATRWNGTERTQRGVPTEVRERGTTSRFPFSAEELHDWADDIGADIVAGMDVACEDTAQLMALEPNKYLYPEDYETRMLESLENQVVQHRLFQSRDYDHELMPVIQGNGLDDYERFIQWMIEEDLAEYEKLALGTVCKRTDRDEILSVVRLVRDYFPDKYLHLFGATLNIWKDERFHGLFDSADTAAWQWGSSKKEDHKTNLRDYIGKIDDAVGHLRGREIRRLNDNF